MKRSTENGMESSRAAGDCMRRFDTFEFIVVGFCYLVALTHKTGIFEDRFLNISMNNTKSHVKRTL